MFKRPYYSSFSNELANKLAEKGYEIEDLVTQAGFSASTIYRWLYDFEKPSDESILRISEFLHCSPEELDESSDYWKAYKLKKQVRELANLCYSMIDEMFDV